MMSESKCAGAQDFIDDQTQYLAADIYKQIFDSFKKQYQEKIEKLEKRIDRLEQELYC